MDSIKASKSGTVDRLFTVSDIVNMNRVSVHACSKGRVVTVSRKMTFTIREVNDAWVKSNR